MTKFKFNNLWSNYWKDTGLSQEVSKISAIQWWCRLLNDIDTDPGWRGLDFGCGYGHLLRQMAEFLDTAIGMDSSPAMVEASKRITADLNNVSVLRSSMTPVEYHNPAFNIVIANSCIQYMPDEELGGWVRWWLGSLDDEGIIILSDVFPSRRNYLLNLLKTLHWGYASGCLRGILSELYNLFRTGYKWGKEYYRDPEDLIALVRSYGGTAKVLPRNLDYLTTRYTVAINKRHAER